MAVLRQTCDWCGQLLGRHPYVADNHIFCCRGCWECWRFIKDSLREDTTSSSQQQPTEDRPRPPNH
jgi:hypothetical protein